jgi:hypothetical protein
VVIHFSKVGGAQSPVYRRGCRRTRGRAPASRINGRVRSGRPSRRLRSVCDGREPGGAPTRPGRL